MRRALTALAVALFLCSLPMFGADCQNPIRAYTVTGDQTGAPVRLQWAIPGVVAISQTLTGHDFDEPVTIPPSQNSYTYIPELPGQKHATITVVTDCGTFSRDLVYFVQECNIVAPILNVDKTTVTAGDVVTAWIDLPPGHRARWVVTGGTPSATTGASIQITAASSGTLRISVFVARGDENSNSCEVRATRAFPISQPCGINKPAMGFSAYAVPNEPYIVYVTGLGAGETLSFNVTGAVIRETGPSYVEVIVPASGSFTVDVIVTKNGCSRTFSRTVDVTPCNPTATVSAAGGNGCDTGKLLADFTGTAPFSGYWSDGESFYTFSNHLERTVTAPGTYTIYSFRDGICSGTVSGQAVVGSGLSVPSFAIDDMAGGWWYGNNTCPGLERTATLTAPVPAGAEVVWSIDNGTILSGQGTATVHWSGASPGQTTLTAEFRSADGCTSPAYNYPYITTQGAPEFAVSVDPAAIDAGGTATVRITHAFATGWGVTSSLGDLIVYRRWIDQNTDEFEYRSTQGAGIATITVQGTNSCGQSGSASTTLTINQGAPVTATATIHQYGTDCTNYGAYAELTGVAPFTGTWSNGTTFQTNYPYAYLYPITPGTFTITDFSDANGPGTVTGSATFAYTELPEPQIAVSNEATCPNAIVTASLTTPVPDGATVNWSVYGATILSGQGTPSIQIQLGEYGASVNVQVTGPGVCSPYGYTYLPVAGAYVQQPGITTYGVYVDTTTNFWVTLDPNTETWSVENSLGDAMQVVGPDPYSPNTYIVSYTSSHGTGQSTIRVWGTTKCGRSFEGTAVMNVLPPPPTITLSSTPNATCGATVTATMTGQPPFTVEWYGNGETETTSEYTLTKFVNNQTYYMYAIVTDASGTRVGATNYLYIEHAPMPYPYYDSVPYACLNAPTTFTAHNIPEGAEVIWSIDGNGRIVGGQGTTEVQVEGTEQGWFTVFVGYRTPEGCTNYSGGISTQVLPPVAQPVITLPQTSIKAGETLDFTAAFDGVGYQSLNWESSNGDIIANQGQNGLTFTLRYISINGPGTATIRVYGTTTCGQQVEATAEITITE